MKAKGEGYGKLILFGEHFVVYGEKAIVSGLKDIKTEVEVRKSEELKIYPKDWDLDSVREAVNRICKYLGVSNRIEIRILKTVPLRQNLGSSAAFSVALSKALGKLYGLGLDNSEIIKASFEGEKSFHGNPSGIDNTASALGKVLSFKKEKDRFNYKDIKLGKELDIAIIPTGIEKKSTKELVEMFKKIKESSYLYEELFSIYRKLSLEAERMLEKGEVEEIAKLMELNHSLLFSYSLSTPEIEFLREKLKREGALSSKLTGAGKGGNIIALFKDEKKAKKAAKKFNGYYIKIH